MIDWKGKLRAFAHDFNEAETHFAQDRAVHDLYNEIMALEKRIEELEEEQSSVIIESTHER